MQVFQQRSRWAKGHWQIFWSPLYNPLLRFLPWPARWHYGLLPNLRLLLIGFWCADSALCFPCNAFLLFLVSHLGIGIENAFDFESFVLPGTNASGNTGGDCQIEVSHEYATCAQLPVPLSNAAAKESVRVARLAICHHSVNARCGIGLQNGRSNTPAGRIVR